MYFIIIVIIIVIIQDENTENQGKITLQKCMICKKLNSGRLEHMCLKCDT